MEENTVTSKKKVIKELPVDEDGLPLIQRNDNGTWDCPFCRFCNPDHAVYCLDCGIDVTFA